MADHAEVNLLMSKAIKIAKEQKTPFAALIVNEQGDFVTAYNTTKQDGPVAHAEINVINKLEHLAYADSKTLTLVSTVEPCPMCMSAIIWAGIGTVVFGASIHDAAQVGKQIDILAKTVGENSWYQPEIIPGIHDDACIKLLNREFDS